MLLANAKMRVPDSSAFDNTLVAAAHNARLAVDVT